jgi:hypothetical protein
VFRVFVAKKTTMEPAGLSGGANMERTTGSTV